MADAKAPAQSGIFGNFRVEFFYAGNQCRKGITVEPFHIRLEPIGIKFGNQLKKAKPAAQDIIADRYIVRHVHHTYDIDILRN